VIVGFEALDLIRSSDLRINTSDTISSDALTLWVRARFVSKSFQLESPRIVSLVRSCVFLFEQVI